MLVSKMPGTAEGGPRNGSNGLRDDMVFNIRIRIRVSNFIAATEREELVGMKMQPKKLRSFAFSTSKNKKIFTAGFNREQACFYDVFFNRGALHFYDWKNR